jgi:hypothetical protein
LRATLIEASTLARGSGACHNSRMSSPAAVAFVPLSNAALYSGYAGIAPFVAALLGVWLAPDPSWQRLSQMGALAWGAVILAFVGALHWGFAIAGRLPATGTVITASVLPSVLGASAVLLDGQRGLALLIAGFGLFGIYEHRRWADSLPAEYLAMRRRLTLAVCASLTLTLFASETVGLR